MNLRSRSRNSPGWRRVNRPRLERTIDVGEPGAGASGVSAGLRLGWCEGSTQELPRFVRVEVEFGEWCIGGLVVGIRAVGAGLVFGVYVERVAFGVGLPYEDECCFLVIKADQGLRQVAGPSLVRELGEPPGLCFLFWVVGEEFLDSVFDRR